MAGWHVVVGGTAAYTVVVVVVVGAMDLQRKCCYLPIHDKHPIHHKHINKMVMTIAYSLLFIDNPNPTTCHGIASPIYYTYSHYLVSYYL